MTGGWIKRGDSRLTQSNSRQKYEKYAFLLAGELNLEDLGDRPEIMILMSGTFFFFLFLRQ